jgi:hypothetical protein
MSSLLEQASLIVTPNAFKAGKLYSIKPTSGAGDLDVVRATTATRVNSAGLIESVANNVPRLDYTNGSCPSCLVEPQRTNLVLRSEEFNDAYWGKTAGATVTANTDTAPDGTMTADTVAFSGSGDSINKFVTLSLNVVNGTTYTFSVFAKTLNQVIFFGGATGGTGTNVYNGAVDYGNGWYRQSVTRTWTTSGTVNVQVLILTGVAATSIIVWGAQAEVGSNPTSYIKTEATAVTRNADVISKTGISDLIGQSEGTMFVDFELQPNNINGNYLFSLSDGTTANLIRSEIFILSPTVSQFRTGLTTSGVGQGDNFTTITQLRNKMAISYSLNNFKLFINGALVYTDTTAAIPATSSFYLGNRVGVGNIIGANYKLASIFKTQLSDQECINLTTL